MSSYERPDRAALQAVLAAAEAARNELASWRDRALAAESQLEVRAAAAPAAAEAGPPASVELEAEATELRRRLAAARELVDLLRTRLRFLEERNEGAA